MDRKKAKKSLNKKKLLSIVGISASLLAVLALCSLFISPSKNNSTSGTNKPSNNGSGSSDVIEEENDNVLISFNFGEGEYANATGVLTYDYDDNYTTPGYDLGFDIIGDATVGGAAANSTAWVTKKTVNGTNNVIEFGKGTAVSNGVTIPSYTIVGDKYVFETDMCVSKTGDGSLMSEGIEYVLQMPFYGYTGTLIGELYVIEKESALSLVFSWPGLGNVIVGSEIKYGEWFRFRVDVGELRRLSGSTKTLFDGKFYFNDSVIFEGTFSSEAAYGNDVYNFAIKPHESINDVCVRLDNTYASYVMEESEETND